MFSFMMNASIGDIQENGKADLWSGKKKKDYSKLQDNKKQENPQKQKYPLLLKIIIITIIKSDSGNCSKHY